MGSPMASGTLKVLSMACWWPFVAIMAENFLLYLGQYDVFLVAIKDF